MPPNDPNPPKINPRRYRLTPDGLLLALLPTVGILWLSDQFRWFPLNEHKNWTVLIAVAVVCATVLLLLVWFGIGLVSRLRFQFGIRSMLVFAAVVAVVCSWFSASVRQAQRQRKTVEEIEKKERWMSEGSVVYDYQRTASGQTVLGGSPSAPVRLRNLLGDDFFAEIVEVVVGPSPWSTEATHIGGINDRQDPPIDAKLERIKHLTRVEVLNLHNSMATDAGLKHIGCMTQLVELHLSQTQITDAGLEHLSGLVHLEALLLDDNRVNGDGLRHIAELHQLRKLTLSGTRVTNPGLAHLKGPGQLQLLDLGGTQVTDAGLKHIEGLHQLRELKLAGTHVTDSGLERLKGLDQLQLLDLDGTKVTDAGLKRIEQLHQLKELTLRFTHVTDAGLEHLNRLGKLQLLDLDGTKVTGAGLERFAEASELQTLSLQFTRVTDAGLANLPRRHPRLLELSIFGSEVTQEGISTFRQALPNCTIHIDPRQGPPGVKASGGGFF